MSRSPCASRLARASWRKRSASAGSDDARPAVHVWIGRLGFYLHLLCGDCHGTVPARTPPHAHCGRGRRSGGCRQHHRAGHEGAAGLLLLLRQLDLVRGSDEGVLDHRGDGLADGVGGLLELRGGPRPGGLNDGRGPGHCGASTLADGCACGLRERHCLLRKGHGLTGQCSYLAACLRSSVTQQIVHRNRLFSGREGQSNLRCSPPLHLPCAVGANRDADTSPAADWPRPVPVRLRDVGGCEV
jgi:hypothetical protein